MLLLALAFLGGGLPRVAAAAVAAAPEALTSTHARHMHAGKMPHVPAKPSSSCQFGTGCLACAAIVLPASVRPPMALRWTSLTFQPTTLRLHGVTPQPELSPPITRA